MRAALLGPPPHPILRLASVAVVLVLSIALADLVFFGPRSVVVGPAPTPSTTAMPTPWWLSVATPEDVIDSNINAWRSGYTAAVPLLYAEDVSTHFVTDHPAFAATDPFLISDASPWPWFTWRRTGAIMGEDPFRAHPTAFHGWEPPTEGFAVYRFGGDGRIAVEWVIAYTAPASSDAGRDAVAAPDDVVRMLDGCLGASSSRDRAAFLACFSPTAVTRASLDSPAGDWTEKAEGIEAIGDAFDRAAGSTAFARSGEMLMQGDFVAFPTRSATEAATIAGIDVIRLDPQHARILARWTFASP